MGKNFKRNINFKIDYNKASHALKAYRQALKDLGAI